jgi:DNA-binding NtrC family response regulator
MRDQYAYDLQRLGGFQTLTAASGAAALQILQEEPVNCLILDLEMPGSDGFEVLRTMKQRGLTVPVIVYTGTGNYERCVRAVKLGAYGFLAKEEPLERVVREVDNALNWSRLSREVSELRRRAGDDSPLVGTSPAMQALQAQIARLAPIPSSVLILGESGSGKELVARQLHNQSQRTSHSFVALNCAALPENLTESELFGHERGAFTGADRTRQGAFETAHEGTLFLDEIGELPPGTQAKLLRVLEEGTVTRVGASRALPVAVRVLAATNRNLEQEVTAGRFRQDLLFRLNVHTIAVPPLRERLSDLPALVDHFLTETCHRFGLRNKTVDPAAVALLQRHDWARNNVRELRNVVERMVIATEAEVLGPEVVPVEIATLNPTAGSTSPSQSDATSDWGSPLTRPGHLKDLKVAAERQIVLAALERNAWHITRTAAELGLADHSSLLKIMRRHSLKRPSGTA